MIGSFPDKQTRDAVRACQDNLPSSPSGGDVIFGFDGFLDNVRTVERSNTDIGERITSLEEFGEEILTSVAAGSSLSVSWNQHGRRTGGHTSHLSRAFQELKFNPTILGMYGDPILSRFEQEFAGCSIYSLGDPGITDAIEFSDGKFMLIEGGGMTTLDWKSLQSQVGCETLISEVDGSSLLGIGYWSVIPKLAGVLDGLRTHVFPELSHPPEHILLDPANIRRLNHTSLKETISATSRLSDITDVTVSANRFETKLLASEFAGDASDDIAQDAHTAFDVVDVDRFVCHGVAESVVVTDEGSASVAVPPIEEPELTTSSGDHFNAGVGLGLIEGFPDDASVALGNAFARKFIQTGTTPSYSDVVSTVESYKNGFE